MSGKEWYAERRAAGLCGGTRACKRPVRPGKSLCQRCWDNRKRAVRAYRQRRKLQGFCAYLGCKEKPDGHMCTKHQAQQTARALRWLEAKNNRKRMRRLAKRRHDERAESGVCVYCTRPLENDRMCSVHRAKALANGVNWRRRHGIGPDTKNSCSNCGQKGHRYVTCKARPADTLSIVEYAASRRSVDL